MVAVSQDRKNRCCHLHGTNSSICAAPKIPDSHFCSAHTCPKCHNDKSSSILFCAECKGAKAPLKKKGASAEEDQLRVLVKKGVISQEECDQRIRSMAASRQEKNIKASHPTTLVGIDTEPEEAVQSEETELVYKLTFDYATKKWERTISLVTIEQESFSEGNLRLAYKMKDWTQPDRDYVAKVSKTDEDEETYFTDVQMQGMCSFFAEEFNKRGPPKRVNFVNAFLIERFTLDPKDKMRLMACEPYLDGVFQKHNNNYGWVNPDDRNTPQVFSHFTAYQSNGQYVVVDIQGVGDKYTDPQILALDGKGLGLGNVGKKGIDKFFASHRCNSICKFLGLTDKVQDFEGTREKVHVPEELSYDRPASKEDLDFFRFTPEFYQNVVDSFKAADADGSGELSLDELPGLLKKLGVRIPTSQLMNVLTNVDKDGSGGISLLEFCFWLVGYEP